MHIIFIKDPPLNAAEYVRLNNELSDRPLIVALRDLMQSGVTKFIFELF